MHVTLKTCMSLIKHNDKEIQEGHVATKTKNTLEIFSLQLFTDLCCWKIPYAADERLGRLSFLTSMSHLIINQLEIFLE